VSSTPRPGRLEQTVNQFEKELTVNPTDADTLADIGIYLFEAGKIDDASARLERAVKLQPGLARALRYLGEERIKQKRHAEGLNLQARALEADPSNVHGFVFARAVVRRRCGADQPDSDWPARLSSSPGNRRRVDR